MDKISQVNFFKHKQIAPMEGTLSINTPEISQKTFKDTVIDMISELNEVTKKPQELSNDFMQGKADIHDVMSAIAQSEITVQAATTMTGKILQTYEKIMQIQI